MSCTSACKHDEESSAPQSRKELQSYLKRNGIRAVGTTDALRAAYQAHQSGWSTAEVTTSVVARSVASPNQTKPAAAKKPSPAEKRLKPFRKKCSQQTRARINRAKSQRLYLVRRGQVSDDLECEFVVLGSTGNVYTVTVGTLPSCTCPDSRKGHHCKHILFVLLKVIGVDSNSPLVYQAALLSSELEQVFSCMEHRRVGGGQNVLANETVRSTYAASLKGDGDSTTTNDTIEETKRKTLEQDADCPICFDSLASGSLTYCRGTCGTNFHEDCIRRWLGQHRTDPTCPNCRQAWQSTGTAVPGIATKEGYANLGKLQGQSQERDTSTYSEWSPYSHAYKRRRY